MTNFNIQIISDSICPWCYVGFRRLSRAITIHKSTNPTDTFNIHWSAFYLNPKAPTYPGDDKREYYLNKVGPERTAAIFARLTSVGETDGIAFKFGGRIGNTRDSHRLAWYAGEKEKETEKKDDGQIGGLQTRVIESLFRAYFEEEKNITDKEVLIEAATNAGLDRAEVEKLLEFDQGGYEVDAEADKAKRRLVTGVPYFMVQGEYAVEGADEPETFLEIFDKIKESS